MVNIFPPKCDFKDCLALGTYKAPKSPTQLRDYYWFCLQHIRQYNAAWNFNGNLTTLEMERYQQNDSLGGRPTWKRERLISGLLYKDFIKNKYPGPVHDIKIFSKCFNRLYSTEEQKALEFFELTEIFEKEPLKVVKLALKRHYYIFVKKYHPDSNKGCKNAENKLRKVINYYRLLKKKLENI